MRASVLYVCAMAALGVVSIKSFAQGPLGNTLRDPSAFSAISTQPERSRAIFFEMAKVIRSPRA